MTFSEHMGRKFEGVVGLWDELYFQRLAWRRIERL